MHKNPTYALLAVGLVLCLPTALAGKPPPTASVLVDCTDPNPTKHDSINEALETPAEELTIEIRGICDEDVVISRDEVTLRGADRMTDGVRGAAPPPGDTVIQIDRANHVRLEELAILGGNRNGVWISGAGLVEIVDSRILDHPRLGVAAVDSWSLRILDTIITAGLHGLNSSGVNSTRVAGCEIEGAVVGVNPSLSGFMRVTDSVIRSASTGVLSDLGGWVGLSDTDVDAPEVLSAWTGQIHMTGGDLGDGYIVGDQKSSISLANVTQAANSSGEHYLISDSLLHLRGTTSLIGTPQMFGFSNLWIEGQSTVIGNLKCESGSDAFCVDVGNITGVSNCAQCPKP